MKRKYILVDSSNSKTIINHPRFKECYLIDSGNDNSKSGTYAVPEDLYEEVYVKKEFAVGEIITLGLKRVIVVERESCEGCIFNNADDDLHCNNFINFTGPCIRDERKDKKPVIFKEYNE